MRHYFILLLSSVFLTVQIAEGRATRSTETTLSWVNISNVGGGSEFQLLHYEPLSAKILVSLGGARVDRFHLVDLQGLLGIRFQEERSWGVDFLAGYNEHGRVLPKVSLMGEVHLNLGFGVSPIVGVKKQNYNDSSVVIASTGVDYEPSIPFIFILRLYLVHTDFDLVSRNSLSGAGMLKILYLGFETHKPAVFGSYGGEGMLRGAGGAVDTIRTWTIGGGDEYRLSTNCVLRPSIDFQRYPTLSTEIFKLNLGFGISW